METRKYFLDWLRVLAFGALIFFHVGMLYVTWHYNLKSPRLYPAIEPWMNALSAWRLALLFLISGVAALVTAFWLFPLSLPVPAEVLLLAGATGLGSFAIYEAAIRPFAVTRFLFGVKPKALRTLARSPAT